MAFLDNSGDIILDAVLTKKGRAALSSGTGLSISQFSLGDDEINYGLYDKNHSSGSAYYDLEILQTPILESFTDINANINYGLLTFTRTDILYMPEMYRLEKTAVSDLGVLYTYLDKYWIAVNQETYDALRVASSPFDGTNKTTRHGSSGTKAIYLETGFDTTALDKTAEGRTSAIADSAGLVDTTYTISVDKRFINNVYGLSGAGAAYANDDSGTAPTSPPASSVATRSSTRTTSGTRMHYNNYTVESSMNQIYLSSEGDYNDYTNIKGPGASVTLFRPSVDSVLITQKDGLRSTKYSDYGKTGQTVSGIGGGVTFDYIDTMVHITGDTSSVTLSIPVRIVRRAT
jgi:hypothetical protein